MDEDDTRFYDIYTPYPPAERDWRDGSEASPADHEIEAQDLAPDGTLEALQRDWHNVVGRSAEWSRPVAIADDQLIVETEQGKSFGARDMGRALDSLGSEKVDRVAIRVTNRTPEELAARLWGNSSPGEKQRDLEMQQAKSRGLQR
jgi:hypothetical protein